MNEDQKELSDRIEKIWDELEPLIGGTGVSSLIEELVDCEIELEKLSNQ